MTRTPDRATADGVVTAWNAHHLEGRELTPTMADDMRANLGLWFDGRIDIGVRRRNPGDGLRDVTKGRKVSWPFAEAWNIHIHVGCARPLHFHPLGLLLSTIQGFLRLVLGLGGKKFRFPLLGRSLLADTVHGDISLHIVTTLARTIRVRIFLVGATIVTAVGAMSLGPMRTSGSVMSMTAMGPPVEWTTSTFAPTTSSGPEGTPTVERESSMQGWMEWERGERSVMGME